MENEVYRKQIYDTPNGKFRNRNDEGDNIGHIIVTEERNCCLIWWHTDDVGPVVIWVGPSGEDRSQVFQAIERACELGREDEQSANNCYQELCDTNGLVQYPKWQHREW